MDPVAVLWIIVAVLVLLALIGVIVSVAGRRSAEQSGLPRQADGDDAEDTRRFADEFDPAFDGPFEPASDPGGDTRADSTAPSRADTDADTRADTARDSIDTPGRVGRPGGRHTAGAPAAEAGQPPPAGRHRRDDDSD
jgi:hypothetical protein